MRRWRIGTTWTVTGEGDRVGHGEHGLKGERGEDGIKGNEWQKGKEESRAAVHFLEHDSKPLDSNGEVIKIFNWKKILDKNNNKKQKQQQQQQKHTNKTHNKS